VWEMLPSANGPVFNGMGGTKCKRGAVGDQTGASPKMYLDVCLGSLYPCMPFRFGRRELGSQWLQTDSWDSQTA
jgi:hypothetical protein